MERTTLAEEIDMVKVEYNWAGMFVLGISMMKIWAHGTDAWLPPKNVFNKFVFLIRRLNWFFFQFRNWKGSQKGLTHKEGTMFMNTAFSPILWISPEVEACCVRGFHFASNLDGMYGDGRNFFLNLLGAGWASVFTQWKRIAQTLVLFWLNMNSLDTNVSS